MAVPITGAARGQGRSHAVRLAGKSADIMAIGVCEGNDVATYPMTSAADLKETVWLVEKTGRRVVVGQVEVCDYAALKSAIGEAIAELGRLVAVIPNAGTPPTGAAPPADAFTGVLDVNRLGMGNTVQTAQPHPGEEGSAVAVGSIMSFLSPGLDDSTAGRGMAAYKLAKHVLVDYINVLASQLAQSGSRANAVQPTNLGTDILLNDPVYTTFWPGLGHPTEEDAAPLMAGVNAMSTAYVDTSDVSSAILSLVSDESRFITGTHPKADAGALVKQGG
ncbi:SDR family oxidoreductase [Streptomyces sp. NPDC019531]|uniref:SDR family oxidoreductase n=1 Tax=Streptomyces sp. NPDC019531 TaxID=3365062 RepID=UPI00384F6ACF